MRLHWEVPAKCAPRKGCTCAALAGGVCEAAACTAARVRVAAHHRGLHQASYDTGKGAISASHHHYDISGSHSCSRGA